MHPCFLNAFGAVNPLGSDPDTVLAGLLAGDTRGMSADDALIRDKTVRVGRVAADLPTLAPEYRPWDSRNNRMLEAALAQIADSVDEAIARYGPSRVGVILGSSTSGVREGEIALADRLETGRWPDHFDYRQQEVGSPSEYLARRIGVGGPAMTVSTACTSSAKAIVSARRMLQSGLADAVLTGGVDTLCRLTLNGFDALESLADDLCNPFSRNRDGINIGEASALFLMTREPGPVEVLGAGESSDAHHISAPDPEGRGAETAMREALDDAGTTAPGIAYANLHGTATEQNDAMEAGAVHRVLGDAVPCSSTKPLVGHTLGAAGATEAGFLWLLLSRGEDRLPPQRWDGEADEDLAPISLCGDDARSDKPGRRIMLSNSFAFGGSNTVLVLAERAER